MNDSIPELPQEVREAIAAEIYATPYASLQASDRLFVDFACTAITRHWPRPVPVTADARELADKVARAADAAIREWTDTHRVNRTRIEVISAAIAAILAPVVGRAEAAERERDQLRAELAVALTTLQLIVDKWDCRSELFISDEETAQNLADTARIALDAARQQEARHD